MSAKEKILIIGDDPGILEVCSIIIKAEGYAVDTARTAGEALTKIGAEFFNLALIDISLPDIEGSDFLPVLLKKEPDTVVIMLTGYSLTQNTAKSLNPGAIAYIDKPFEPDHLLQVISSGLEKQRLIFENRQLIKELENRNRDLGILLSISQTVSQSLDLTQIINSAVERISKLLEVDACSIHLLENFKFGLKGDYGLSAETKDLVGELKISSSLFEDLFKIKNPVAVEFSNDETSGLGCLAGEGYFSCTCIPLMIGEETLGVMNIMLRSCRKFTDRELGLLAAIGREASIAIRNSRLYEAASSVKALGELDLLRTQLLANVSHELRTPLAAIKGFSSTLLQTDVTFDEQTRRNFIQIIDRESDKLNNLIEELLIESRIESGTFRVQRKCYNISEVIASVKDRLDTLTESHKLSILVPRDLPQVEVDSNHIGQVLANLVENSVKYSPEDTLITIESRVEGKELITSVTDEGIGIAPEFHQGVHSILPC